MQKTVLQNKFGIEFQAFPAQGIKAVVKENFAYVTAGIAGLFVVDIQDPADLRQTAYLDFPEAVSLIGICGSHIYLPTQNSLYIVDITDPLHPACVLKIPQNTDETVINIAMDSDRMYMFDEKNIKVFSLENPAEPLQLTSFSPDNMEGTVKISDIAVLNGITYIASEQKGIGIYDFSDIENIVYKDQYNNSDGYYSEVDFYGNYAYLNMQDNNSIEILNISNIEKPEFINAISSVQSIICVEGNTAYVVNDLGCMSIIDLPQYHQKTAYITIDDGPSRSITPINLDTLKKYGVKATFFVLPRTGVDDIYKRILDEGHVIGNHSYSHDYNYLNNSTDNFKKDVLKARNLIIKKFKYTSTVFRFPGGTMGLKKSTVKDRTDILADLGYRYFDWDVTMADTDPKLKTYGNEEYIVNLLANNVIKGTKNREKLIILMHDSSGKKYSAKALPKIIEGLQKQGYAFDVLTNY